MEFKGSSIQIISELNNNTTRLTKTYFCTMFFRWMFNQCLKIISHQLCFGVPYLEHYKWIFGQSETTNECFMSISKSLFFHLCFDAFNESRCDESENSPLIGYELLNLSKSVSRKMWKWPKTLEEFDLCQSLATNPLKEINFLNEL